MREKVKVERVEEKEAKAGAKTEPTGGVTTKTGP